MVPNATKVCVCDSTIAITLSNRTCLKCSDVPSSTGIPGASNTCQCQASLVWVSASSRCECSTTSILISTDPSQPRCITCNSSINSNGKASATSCTCINNRLVWNSNGFCDCGPNSSLTIANNNYTCTVCNATIYSTGKDKIDSCICSPPLVWNSVNRTCDCGINNVVKVTTTETGVVYSCSACTVENYATARVSVIVCSCLSTAMQWNSTLGLCECRQANSVLFTSGGNYSCVACNSNILAVSKLGVTSCNCPNADFVWRDSVGCVCKDPNTIVTGSGANSKCVVCDISIYANGISNTTTCKCLGSLQWINGSCGCNATSFISKTYTCIPCAANINARAKLSPTSCSCLSTLLAWLP